MALQNGVVGGNHDCSPAVVLCVLLPSVVHTSLETHRDLCLLMHQVWQDKHQLEYGPMPNLMVALPNIGGALCSTPQSLADAHY